MLPMSQELKGGWVGPPGPESAHFRFCVPDLGLQMILRHHLQTKRTTSSQPQLLMSSPKASPEEKPILWRPTLLWGPESQGQPDI